MKSTNEICHRLREARKNAGMTQKQVCESIGLNNAQTLSAYERGRVPSAQMIQKLSSLYGVSVNSILNCEYIDAFNMFRDDKIQANISFLMSLVQLNCYISNVEPREDGLSVTVSKLDSNMISAIANINAVNILKQNDAFDDSDIMDFVQIIIKKYIRCCENKNGYEH